MAQMYQDMYGALGRGGIVVAAGIIVSRMDDSDEWFHSNCQLVLNEAGFGADLCSLEKAVEKSYAVAEIDIESELYLNNADTRGNSDGNNGDDASVANGNAG